MISTAPFDDTTVNPLAAIAQAVHKRHGIVPHLPHWSIIARYQVKTGTASNVSTKGEPKGERKLAGFDRVYIAQFDAPQEKHFRQKFGIADHQLNPMVHDGVTSWYLVPVDSFGD